jgi:gliding motility-associated-like protein
MKENVPLMLNTYFIPAFKRPYRILPFVALLLFTLICNKAHGQTTVPFSYTGATQTFTVPPCVKSIHVKAWGGGGSGGGADVYGGAGGGGGGFTSADIAVVPGQVLTIIVGGGGGAGADHVSGTGGGPGGWGNGQIDGAAGGVAGNSGSSGGGGGGGGGTAVFNGATAFLVAPGGGGGSGGGQFSSGALGGGGGQNGNSVAGSCTSPGITGASANGNGTIGGNKGGADGGGGGGGGGGYLGGTGGAPAASCDCGACGGAGGSGYSSGTAVVITNGANATPGNNADPDLPAGDAIGGPTSTSGGNGFLLISYMGSGAPPTSQVTSFVNPSCFNGTNGSATAAAAGGAGAPYTYSWNPSAQTTPTATNLGAGTYTVTVMDVNGCNSTATQTITQPTQLLTTVSGIQSSCKNSCNGQIICIPKNGTTPYSYSWSTGCTMASCNNVCAGTYSITVTDANGCKHVDSAIVSQPPAIALAVSSTKAHCNKPDGNASVAASGGTGAFNYTWFPIVPGSSAASYPNITPGNYTVLVHDANGCADSNTVAVANIPGVTASIGTSTNPSCFMGNNGTATATVASGTPAYTYSWSPAPGGGQGTATASGLSAGSYTCLVTDSSGCLATATAVIGQPPLVTVTPMAPATICIGQCIPLTAQGAGGTPGFTYTWALNAAPFTPPSCAVTTTTYTVVATDSNKCVSSPQTVTITVNPPLEVLASAGTSVCPGLSTNLTAVGSGGNGSYSYSWVPATGLSNTAIPNPVATPPATTTYTVGVYDNCGTPIDTALVTVTVFPVTSNSIMASDTAGCAPLCVNFTQLANPACQTVVWNYGDGTTGKGCAGNTYCYTKPGIYTVGLQMTDVNGCKTVYSKTNLIDVYALPKALFTASPQPTTLLEPTITFGNTTADTTCTWIWTFGNPGDSSSVFRNPKPFTYLDSGCYPVRLVATNPRGCKDTSRMTVCIDPIFTFYAPNAFTPNADGLNDVWLPQGVGVDPNQYSLHIFDRWGSDIFSTTLWGQGWDGKANNGPNLAQNEVYIWQIDLKDFQGKHHHLRGSCLLIK